MLNQQNPNGCGNVKGVGLCWPKIQVYKPNEPFKRKIHERGPNKDFVVSLYAVDQTCHQDILKWFDETRITSSNEGFPIIPETFKLDSATLFLKEVYHGEKEQI